MECNKFCGAHENITNRRLSGHGVKDVVTNSLDFFLEVEKHQFLFSHCWKKLKDFPKWQASYAIYKREKAAGKHHPGETVDLDSGDSAKPIRGDRPRGHKATKQDMKRDASALALESTLKAVLAEKEEVWTAREERRRQQKEVAMTNFAALQQKAIEVRERQLQIDEANARATAKKIELKEKEVAATLLAEENRIMTADLSKMDPGTRAWFEKRQRLILSRDD